MSSGSWAYEVFVRALAAGTVEAPRDADPDNFAIVPADFPIGEALTRVTRQRPVLVVVSDEDDIEIYLPRRVWP